MNINDAIDEKVNKENQMDKRVLEFYERTRRITIICEKFDFYKSEMDKGDACPSRLVRGFKGDIYPFRDLNPSADLIAEGPIDPEALEFEEWFDRRWLPIKRLEESQKAEMNKKRYFGKTLGELLIDGSIYLSFIAVIVYYTCLLLCL